MIISQRFSVLFLIIFGFVLYFNSLFNSFVWDDEEQIINNSYVHSITNFPLFFRSSTFNSGGTATMEGLYYKPMMSVFFSLLYTIFGQQSFFFHLFQVSLHLVNSVLVFLILKKILEKSNVLPFLISLVFLVHPINTEAVVYISSLQDILFFFFGAWAFYLTTKFKFSFAKWFMIGALLLFSLLSKETSILFIAIIGFYLFIYQKSFLKNYLISITGSLIVYLILRIAIAGIYFKKHGLSPISTMSFDERLLSIPKIIYFYIKTFIFPKDLAISQHWSVRAINGIDFYWPLLLDLGFFLILLIIGVYFYKKVKNYFKEYLFFVAWFVIGLIAHLQLIPLDMTVSDRWFYFPSVGIASIVIIAIYQIYQKYPQTRKILTVLFIGLIISLSIRTFVRTFNWRSGLSIYSHDIIISKDTFDIENNLGVELYRNGRFDEAAIHFKKSTQLAPFWWTNWNNLGVIEEKKGNYSLAIDYYQKSIDNGRYYLGYENLANVLFSHDSPASAIAFIEKSLQVLPQNGKLWLILSLAEYRMGDKDKALYAARQSYLISPNQQNYYIYSRLSQNMPLE